MKDKIKSRNGIIGLAIGDAMGLPLKLTDRNQLIQDPVISMKDGGIYGKEKGTWFDSTMFVLSIMDSIIKYSEISLEDLGNVFIDLIEKNKEKSDNICLAGMLPIAYYCYYSEMYQRDIYELIKKICYLMNVQDNIMLGYYLYVLYAVKLLEGKSKFDAYREIKEVSFSRFSRASIDLYSRIIKKDIYEEELNSIRSTNSLVDTLEASLWVLLNTEGYNQAIIGAINLGMETDVIGACTGGLAGIIYGIERINSDWKIDLKKYSFLRRKCDSFDNALIPDIQKLDLPKYIIGNEEKIIKIIQGDITKLNVDACVNPANNSLLGGEGIDGAIHEAAGAELIEKCKELDGCESGEAKITSGYNSKAKYIIHTVAPKWYDEEKNDKERILRECYQNSLNLAIDFGCRKIAIPCLGIGLYGCPIEIAAKIAIDFALGVSRSENQDIEVMYLVCAGNTEYEYYMKYFKECM